MGRIMTAAGGLLAEVCHFVDALRFLAGSPVKTVQVMCIQTEDKRQVNRASVRADRSGPKGTPLQLCNLVFMGRIMTAAGGKVVGVAA